MYPSIIISKEKGDTFVKIENDIITASSGACSRQNAYALTVQSQNQAREKRTHIIMQIDLIIPLD
jgi:pyruvate/2-oxoacid:ferredoxin oxidoreductase alpha subunit